MCMCVCMCNYMYMYVCVIISVRAHAYVEVRIHVSAMYILLWEVSMEIYGENNNNKYFLDVTLKYIF